jgi:putative ABC transport system permease protein
MVESRRIALRKGAFDYELDIMDVDTFLQHGSFVPVKGDLGKVRQALLNGEGALVSEIFANRTGLTAGDVYRARVGPSLVEIPILDVIRDYRTSGGVVFYDLSAFRRRYHDPGVSGVRMFFREPPPDPAAAVNRLRREVLQHCGDRLDLVNGADLRDAVLRIFDETFAVTTVLLLIALIIAALGIAVTLAVQVLERCRLLNTMFAVGGSYQQIRAVIFWEAVILVLVGQAVGLFCGFLLSYLLIYVINVQSFGWSFVYQIDWRTLSVSLPLIALAAVLAALPAVRLTFREPPASLLRER